MVSWENLPVGWGDGNSLRVHKPIGGGLDSFGVRKGFFIISISKQEWNVISVSLDWKSANVTAQTISTFLPRILY